MSCLRHGEMEVVQGTGRRFWMVTIRHHDFIHTTHARSRKRAIEKGTLMLQRREAAERFQVLS